MIALILLAAQTAAPQAIPRYDVDHQCAERSRGLDSMNPDRGAVSAAAKNLCVHREQEAYDELKVLWPRYDADLRTRCRQVCDTVGNYEVLLNCIVSMGTVQATRRSKPFRY